MAEWRDFFPSGRKSSKRARVPDILRQPGSPALCLSYALVTMQFWTSFATFGPGMIPQDLQAPSAGPIDPDVVDNQPT